MTIAGCGFTGATGVTFGSTGATTFTVASDTQITATSPAHAAGTVDVTVQNPVGSSATSPDDLFTFITPGTCANATVAPTRGSPAFTDFTATSGGCTNPVFKWWVWGANTGWVLKQDYSSNNSFSLDLTTLAPGTYSVDVWVERTGQPGGTYETFALTSQVVGDCQSATLTPNPAPTTGTIHFQATSGGTLCISPEYQYWTYSGGTGWVIKQPFSSTSTFDLDTSTLASTNWSVVVWVKQATSTNLYDTWAVSSIPKGQCGDTTVTGVPASPQNLGGTVNFTATAASGCTGAQYKYWIFPSQNGAHQWQMVQDFSSSGAFAWNTAGWLSGSYTIDVWVKTTGSTNVYDTYGLAGYSITGPSSAGLTSSPASPTQCCSAVTFTATSTGATSPQYQYWIYLGGWQVLRDWNASPTTTWTPPHTGTFAIVVFARQAGAASGDFTWAELSYSATP